MMDYHQNNVGANIRKAREVGPRTNPQGTPNMKQSMGTSSSLIKHTDNVQV